MKSSVKRMDEGKKESKYGTEIQSAITQLQVYIMYLIPLLFRGRPCGISVEEMAKNGKLGLSLPGSWCRPVIRPNPQVGLSGPVWVIGGLIAPGGLQQ